MAVTFTQSMADILNNMSPASQNVLLGNKIKSALEGDLADGSISTSELANLAVTDAKIAVGAVSTTKLANNAVSLAKISLGLKVGIACEDALTTDRDTMNVAGLASAIALANALKVTTNAHGADGVEHGTSADSTNYPVATADASDLATLLTLTGDLLTAYDTHEADAELAGAWVYHNAQEAGDHSLASAVAPTDLNEAITRLNDLKTKYNAHDADSTAHTTGSTHQEATANGALSATIVVSESGVASGDEVVWGILNSGTGSVTGVTAVAGTDQISFTFSAEPQDDTIIAYAVFRTAT